LIWLYRMKVEYLAQFIDITILKPHTTIQQIEETVKEAKKYPFASLCIPPFYVPLVYNLLKGSNLKISSVVGFPLGYQQRDAKLFEASGLVKSGASELDVVMNITAFKSGMIDAVRDELSSIVLENSGIVVKVIIETSLLDYDEKVNACKLVIDSGAHFVKTSTGFGSSGATLNDVRLLKSIAGDCIKVKASGGIKDLQNTLAFIEAGASRIGTSSGIEILKELKKKGMSPE